MSKIRSLKISISGVRGIVGESLSPLLVNRFAQAFGTYCNSGKIVVGRDTRVSGEMVKYAVFAGLMSSGCTVVDVDICPVPTLQIMVRELNADGGIMITASHNPVEWNALKFMREDGIFLNPSQAEELVDIYHQGEFKKVSWRDFTRIQKDKTAIDTHIAKVLKFVDVDRIRQKKFKVAVDCCNGAGAVAAPVLLNALGCEIIAINDTPDGLFPRNPEPLPENLGSLCSATRKNNADIGFAQDADADRLAIVSEQGKCIGEDYTLALACQFILSRKPGTAVVNLSATRAIDDIANMYHSKVIRTKIGEVYVAEKMKQIDAVVGGEGNGGVIIPEINYGRDSIGGIAVILQHLAESNKTISQLVNTIPQYHIAKAKVALESDKIFTFMKKFREKYESQRINLLDGIRVDFDDYWIHVRPSNTEPIVRIVAEAKNRERADALCSEIVGEIKGGQK